MAVRPREKSRLLTELEATLAELDEAEELLKKVKGSRAYIGFSGGIMIEVPKEDAIEYIEQRRVRLRVLLEQLRKEAQKG